MPGLRQTGQRKLSHSRSTTKNSIQMTDDLGLHDVARECRIPSVWSVETRSPQRERVCVCDKNCVGCLVSS